jgi:hypothetical protein
LVQSQSSFQHSQQDWQLVQLVSLPLTNWDIVDHVLAVGGLAVLI